jgi:hypothetical protein
VCGRGSALDEVSAGTALQVDASRAADVADAAWLLVSDAAARQDAVAHGITRAASFGWATTALRTLEVFRRALAAS